MDERLKQSLKALTARLGYRVQRWPPDPLPLWDFDGRFNDLMREVVGHTLLDKERCFMLYQYARHTAALPGDAAEVGVYRGGGARLLAGVFGPAGKALHLFDTFEGMPDTDPERDHHTAGQFADTSLEAVKGYMGDRGNVHYYKGLFPGTAKPIEGAAFCMAHIDADIYSSIKDSCEFFYPRMQRGGVIVFDDYGAKTCPGVKKAVDEFFSDKPEYPCYLPTGQCVVARL